MVGIGVLVTDVPFKNTEAPTITNTPSNKKLIQFDWVCFGKRKKDTNTTSIHITKPVISNLGNKSITDGEWTNINCIRWC